MALLNNFSTEHPPAILVTVPVEQMLYIYIYTRTHTHTHVGRINSRVIPYCYTVSFEIRFIINVTTFPPTPYFPRINPSYIHRFNQPTAPYLFRRQLTLPPRKLPTNQLVKPAETKWRTKFKAEMREGRNFSLPLSLSREESSSSSSLYRCIDKLDHQSRYFDMNFSISTNKLREAKAR